MKILFEFNNHRPRHLLFTAFIGCGIIGMTQAFAEEDIRVKKAWINEAPPTVKVMAGYLEIENKRDSAIVLIHVSSTDFEKVEMHRSVVIDGIAKMLPQKNIEIKPNSSLIMRPGDYHLMLMKPIKKVKAGDSVPLSLIFADASIIVTSAVIQKIAGNAQHHHH